MNSNAFRYKEVAKGSFSKLTISVSHSGKITRNTKEKTGLRVASINSQLDQSGFRW